MFSHNGLSIVIKLYDGIISNGLFGITNDDIIIVINPNNDII